MAFRIIAGIAFVGCLTFAVFRTAEWHAGAVSLPRYCDDPRFHLEYVREILTKETPAGEGQRRPYLIAAKLLYLEPRRNEEPIDPYLARLERRIAETCS